MSRVLITGTNRGIGLELVRQLRARGDAVIAVCREPSPELEACGVDVFSGIDVSQDSGLKKLAELTANETLDVVLNNAGVLRMESIENLDVETIREQLEVNSIAPLRVATTLLPRLADPAKLVVITSRMGSLTDNTSGGMYGYRMSKAAVNAAFVSLARDLAPRNVHVGIIHPGFVKTDMTGGNGNVGPDEAAAQIIARIDELDAAKSGSFRHANGEQLPW